jgi:signal transduction histidine kinase
LLSLINDILDLSKIEAGKVKFTPEEVSLPKLLENSLFMVKEKALKHNIQLSLSNSDVPDWIMADERLIKQVLYNLLGNAVKFTPEQGRISLIAEQTDCYFSSAKRKDDTQQYYFIDFKAPDPQNPNIKKQRCLKVSVKDSGIGIAPEYLGHVFNRFDQVENSTNRQFEGTGLGLALAKNFIELHGGRIWAESEGDSQGSTFSFVIPLTSCGEMAVAA